MKAALLLIAALVAVPAQDGTPLRLPAPAGPHPVGVRSASVHDPARIDESTGRARRLPIRVWYPAASSHGRPARYLTPGVQREFAHAAGLPESWLDVDTHATENAKFHGRPRGIVLVQHGGGMLAAFQTGQVIELASRGWVVVTMEHPHESFAVEEADGQVIKGAPNAETVPFAERIRDGSLVLDALPRLVPEAGRGTPVTMFGQSRGGSATAELMFHHPRIRAGVLLDSQARGDVATAGLDRPLGIMHSLDFPLEYLQSFLDLLTGPHPVRQLPVRHNGYTDFVLFNAQAERAAPGTGVALEGQLETGTVSDPALGRAALDAQRDFLRRNL